ncbi:MAG: hypothetical protein A2X46_06025 [Lentisphaerae bacterium GWF2_57_35]|nr:MAG: hypothetical protein A2X46_06025 [Lentisphaerae bacterium GWF2_57_35]
MGSCLFAAVGFAASVVWAADHSNLEEDQPVSVEDAFATAYLNYEIQGLVRYEKLDTGDEDRLMFQPMLEYGVWRNTEVQVHAPFYTGDDDKHSGDLNLGALYNFNQESVMAPATALEGELALPTGEGSHGVDPTVKLILTKTVEPESFSRVHLNAAYTYNARPQEDERDHLYALTAGYSFRPGADTIVIVDVLREREREGDEAISLLEAGVRQQLDPLTVLGLGGGVGLNDEAPDYRVTLSAQRSF